MKKIKTSDISSTARLPLLKEGLAHLQESYQECIDALAKAVIRNYTTGDIVILTGCVNSTTAPIYTISAGYVYYNGEVYAVDATTFTSAGADVAVANIVTTYNAIDPVTFTDGTPYFVHEVRKMVLTSAAAGSGLKNFSEFKTLTKIATSLYSAADFGVNTGAWQDLTSMSYTTPADGVTRTYLLLFKATYEVSGGFADSTGEVRIYNDTDAAELDFGKYGKENLGATEKPWGHISLAVVVSIAPNKTIKAQAKMLDANTTIKYSRMNVIEL